MNDIENLGYGGTAANEGTQGSLVRMTPDIVFYSWMDFDMSI